MKDIFSRYKTAFGAFLSLFVNYGSQSSFGIFLPVIEEESGLSFTQVSMSITVTVVVAFIGSLCAVRIMPLITYKRSHLAGSVMNTTGLVITAFSNSSLLLYLGSIFSGTAWGFCSIACTSAILNENYTENKKKVIGYVLSATTLGAMGMILIAGILLENTGRKNAYLILALIQFTVAVLSNILLIPPGQKQTRHRCDELISKEKQKPVECSKTVFGYPSFWLIFAAVAISSFFNISFRQFSPKMWVEGGIGIKSITFFLSLLNLLSGISVFLSGIFLERPNKKPYLSFIYLSGVLCIASLFAWHNLRNTGFIIISLILFSFAAPAAYSMTPTILYDAFGSKNYNKNIVMIMPAMYMGMSFSPLFFSYTKHITGEIIYAYLITASLLVCALAILITALKLAPEYKRNMIK